MQAVIKTETAQWSCCAGLWNRIARECRWSVILWFTDPTQLAVEAVTKHFIGSTFVPGLYGVCVGSFVTESATWSKNSEGPRKGEEQCWSHCPGLGGWRDK
jgi:hypothetical protein